MREWAERLERRGAERRSLAVREGLVDLTSNDTLGFSRAPERIEALNRVGATGSRLLTGQCHAVAALEERVAAAHGAESALVFNSGYNANLGLLSALGTKEVTFIYDLQVHASLIDGMRLSNARCVPFRHNDLASLERRLKATRGTRYVLVESIYSVSGERAPLEGIAQLCERWGAEWIVDEANATGVHGAGLSAPWRPLVRLHTFSKALGSQGAAVVGPRLLKELLVNFARPFIYTTALSAHSIAAIGSAYDKLERDGEALRRRLEALISYFEKGRKGTGTFIQPIVVPGAERARKLSLQLAEKGLDVRAIVSPTAPRGREHLRVVLHSFNTEEEIDGLHENCRCGD